MNYLKLYGHNFPTMQISHTSYCDLFGRNYTPPVLIFLKRHCGIFIVHHQPAMIASRWGPSLTSNRGTILRDETHSCKTPISCFIVRSRIKPRIHSSKARVLPLHHPVRLHCWIIKTKFRFSYNQYISGFPWLMLSHMKGLTDQLILKSR